jgi:hypothetical protein
VIRRKTQFCKHYGPVLHVGISQESHVGISKELVKFHRKNAGTENIFCIPNRPLLSQEVIL